MYPGSTVNILPHLPIVSEFIVNLETRCIFFHSCFLGGSKWRIFHLSVAIWRFYGSLFLPRDKKWGKKVIAIFFFLLLLTFQTFFLKIPRKKSQNCKIKSNNSEFFPHNSSLRHNSGLISSHFYFFLKNSVYVSQFCFIFSFRSGTFNKKLWLFIWQLTVCKELDWQAIWPVRMQILCAATAILPDIYGRSP